MNRETALRILGLEGKPSKPEIDDARRAMIAVLHPDKHPGTASEVFVRLTRDVNEAAALLNAPSEKARLADETELEATLFEIHASAQWNRAVGMRGNALATFDKRYAKDKILAVAVLGLDPNFAWTNTSSFTGDVSEHRGTALYLLAWNRTRRRVEGLDVSDGFLVDDKGNQYSPDGAFYWQDTAGSFKTHSTTLVPNAKLDGFLLYPELRPGATAFTRWYLADSLNVGDSYISAEYDIELPMAPQQQARISSQMTIRGDEGPEESDDEGSDELSDDWLYGK